MTSITNHINRPFFQIFQKSQHSSQSTRLG